MWRHAILLLACLTGFGCLQNDPRTPDEIRRIEQIESREFEAPAEDVYRAVTGVVLDLGFFPVEADGHSRLLQAVRGDADNQNITLRSLSAWVRTSGSDKAVARVMTRPTAGDDGRFLDSSWYANFWRRVEGRLLEANLENSEGT